METSSVQICVPVCVERASEVFETVRHAASLGNLVELRLDCLAEPARELLTDTAEFGVPIILTMRAPAQGGHNSMNYHDRLGFWSSVEKLPVNCLVDIELDLIPDLFTESVSQNPVLSLSRLICSHHDFAGVPSDLEQIYERLAATGSRILKIAVSAGDATDCLPVFRLLDRAAREGREMIAIAMGQAGVMTRILAPSRGAFLTYGALDGEKATAPGQSTARDLREVYRIERIDRGTEIMGLIGKPVSHSISPHIHNAAFAAAEIDAVFMPIEVNDLSSFMRRMVRESSREIDWNIRGLSVTAPHKRSVMELLDWIEPVAQEIGAVNTIVAQDGELHGYNTDAAGFLFPLREKYGALRGARCAIIGAGGAARAALWGLRREGATMVLFVREQGRAKPVAAEFEAESRPIVNASFDGFDILVNATPLGTSGARETETPVTAAQFRGVRLAYDLVYNPLETQFQREARTAGCETMGGIHMLIAQAIEQFKLWTGREPDVEVMRAAALRALGSAA